MARPRVLYLEPFHGGSHASFGDALIDALPEFEWCVRTLPARHWKWRMRGSAVTLAERAPEGPYGLIVASSYLPLAEFLGLRPDLAGTPSVLYFHENQLAFPARPGERHPERDHHFGFTQIVSSLAATRCAFNSAFNRDSFLGGARDLLRRMPDQSPGSWVEAMERRSTVLPLPLSLPDLPDELFEAREPDPRGPLLLWNHRWEHDKAPEVFFSGLEQVRAPFRLAVCGQRFSRSPPAFERGRVALGDRVVHWGGDDERQEYEAWLRAADVVVSTARHEFFGIAVVEAMHFGARPLVPDALAYRETVPDAFRYAEGAFVPEVERLCDRYLEGVPLRADHRRHTRRFSRREVLPQYSALFQSLLR